MDNTRRFDLYVSGILYARLRLGGQGPLLQKLDVYSGAFSPWGPLTPEDRDFYKSFVKLDLGRIAEALPAYEAALRGRGEVWVDGERYTSEDGVTYRQRDVKFPANKRMDGGRLTAVCCPAREMAVALVEPGQEDTTFLRDWRRERPAETLWPVAYDGEHAVPMRDGVRLATDVYLPAGCPGPVPAVLVRTPYGKEDGREAYYRYVQRGYAVVIQDVRGRNKSEGEWMPNYYEVEDGDDTLNWIAAQPWCSRRIGMVGGSYLGFVQWAAAASGNPYLKALISVVCAGSPFVDLPRRGGSFTSGSLAWAFAVSQKQFKPELMERVDWDEVLNIRPLAVLPRQALGYDVPFLTRWLQPGDYDDFWRRADWSARAQGAVIPALIQSGWFDDNGMGTTEALDLTAQYPRGLRKVILGPWQHSGNSRYDLHALHFGPDALRFDLDRLYFRWFDHFLKGIENGVEQSPPVEYYTTGQERWKTAATWPPENTAQTALYLAGGTPGWGRLVGAPPPHEGADAYDYDPRDPAVHIIDLSENELEVPEDYTEQEQRPDVLCFTTDVLEHDLVVTGDMTVRLYVSSDAPDTDFIVRVTDVDAQGRSRKLADGMRSARYRGGFDHAEFLQPGEVVPLVIRTTKISHCFARGHRLRLTVTSSAKNFIFPHSNTREGYHSARTVVAHNAVHYGGRWPACLLLPVEER